MSTAPINTTFALAVHGMALKWVDHRLGQIRHRLWVTWAFKPANKLHLEQRTLEEIKRKIEHRIESLGEGVRAKPKDSLQPRLDGLD